MSKPELRHELVSFKRGLEVCLVDSNGNTHEHVLGPFNNFVVNFEQVRAFQCLEAEEIVAEIFFVIDNRLYGLGIFTNYLINIIC